MFKRLRFLLLVTVALTGCQKDLREDGLVPEPQQPYKMHAEQRERVMAAYKTQLRQRLNEMDSISWEPQWQEVTQHRKGKAASYVYVPLRPITKASIGGRKSGPIKIMGLQKFLIAQQRGSSVEILIATYYASRNGAAALSREPTSYSKFTGVALLHNLSTKRNTYQKYVGGNTSQRSIANSSTTGAAESTICSDYWTCNWENDASICSNGVSYIQTAGYNGCMAPDFPVCGQWRQVQTTIERFCYSGDDPPLPGDPGGGGGGGGGTEPTGPTDPTAPWYSDLPYTTVPCDALRFRAANPDYAPMLNALKNKVHLDYEVGYLYKLTSAASTRPASVVSIALQGTPGGGLINFPLALGERYSGLAHTHYDNLLSIFSGQDLDALYRIYMAGGMTYPESFILELVTANNTVYAIRIEDPTKFKAFGDNWFAGGEARWIAFESLFFDFRYNIKTTNTNEQNELGFLQLLKGFNSGLSLSKGDPNNMNSWSRLTLNSDEQSITSTACP